MKKLFTICLLAVATLAACKKNDAIGNNGCIARTPVIPVATMLSPADQARVSQLFQQNNIPVNGLNFYRYTYDPNNYVLPGPYEYIRADQNLNGLPIFNSDVLYNFRQGTLYYTGGNRYTGVNIDTTPRLTLPQLRSVYLTAMATYNKQYVTLKDSCLTAQFGYYDLGSINGQTSGQLVKAWKVTIGHFEYPVAYLRDDNDSTIYIDNGIRTFTN